MRSAAKAKSSGGTLSTPRNGLPTVAAHLVLGDQIVVHGRIGLAAASGDRSCDSGYVASRGAPTEDDDSDEIIVLDVVLRDHVVGHAQHQDPDAMRQVGLEGTPEARRSEIQGNRGSHCYHRRCCARPPSSPSPEAAGCRPSSDGTGRCRRCCRGQSLCFTSISSDTLTSRPITLSVETSLPITRTSSQDAATHIAVSSEP